jgi:hypothetical protein
MRAIVAGVLLLAMSVCCQAEEEWQSLFNGKDLTGWKANDPEAFVVEDGAIVTRVRNLPNRELFYVGDLQDKAVPFKNFELEATVKAEKNSNSGIFVHTEMTPVGTKGGPKRGYEVQLNNSKRDPRKTGSLYEVVDLDKSPVDETKWFQVCIVVRDKRITIAIDGKEVVDYTEPEHPERSTKREGRLFMPDGGAIALQAHDKTSVWYFKEIRVKRLP